MPLPVTSRSEIGEVKEPHLNVLATDTRIPILLGTAEVFGRWLSADKTGSTWTVSIVWCEGPVIDIEYVHLNGAVPPNNVTITNYFGHLDQGIDPTLAALLMDYADTNTYAFAENERAFAYSVIEYPDSAYADPPTFTAKITGPTQSSDAVVCAQYFLERIGEIVNEESFLAARAYTAKVIDETEARREMGVIIDDQQTMQDWVRTLEGYIGGRLIKLGDEWFFNLDTPTQDAGYLHPSMWIDGSLKIKSAVRENIPNRVEVVYTHTYDDGTIGYEVAVADTLAVEQNREQPRINRVSLPGITRYSQALREAKERLNKLRAAHNEYEITGLYELLRFIQGDKIEISIDDEVRLCTITETPALTTNGTVRLNFSDFDKNTYNDEVVEEPEIPHGNLVIGE